MLPGLLAAAVPGAAMVTKIATMRTLQGHPNMLQLHGVFEDEEGFHVVVEYCKGAALLEQIHDKVRPSDTPTAETGSTYSALLLSLFLTPHTHTHVRAHTICSPGRAAAVLAQCCRHRDPQGWMKRMTYSTSLMHGPGQTPPPRQGAQVAVLGCALLCRVTSVKGMLQK